MAVDQSGNYKLATHIDDSSALWGTVVQARKYGCDATGASDDDHVGTASGSRAIVDFCADIGCILLIHRRQSAGICTPQCHCGYKDAYAIEIHRKCRLRKIFGPIDRSALRYLACSSSRAFALRGLNHRVRGLSISSAHVSPRARHESPIALLLRNAANTLSAFLG